jgi:hypothetical protein
VREEQCRWKSPPRISRSSHKLAETIDAQLMALRSSNTTDHEIAPLSSELNVSG